MMTMIDPSLGRRSVRTRPLVERPAPGKAPVAFRIWAYGPNQQSDGKTVIFSERSAEALLAEQASRGLLYSFDFDHRSIMPDVSPEAGKAAGWHVLEVRQDDVGKPELWASACDWTAEARAGIEGDPPEWKYFSPCFDVDTQTREVMSYVNCALTNNPLTHGIPALASMVHTSSSCFDVARARARGLVARSQRLHAARQQASAFRAMSDRIDRIEAAAAKGSAAKAWLASALGRVRALEARAAHLPKSSVELTIDQAGRNTLRGLGLASQISRRRPKAAPPDTIAAIRRMGEDYIATLGRP